MSVNENGELYGKVVTVIGGSGFFGKHLAQELLSRGARLRVASRNPERSYTLKPLGNLGQVTFERCDVTRPQTLASVIQGSDVVINLVGAFKGDLDAIQIDGAANIAKAASQAGVDALVHVSAIGGDAKSAVAYARTKAEGELAVLAAFPSATIVRPSLLFGADDNFIQLFARLVSRFKVLPVFAPEAKLQPLFVDDAAKAISAILAAPTTHAGKVFELGGPETITMLDLNRRIAEAQGRKRSFIELPDSAGSILAKIAGFLPGAPINGDQYALLRAGSVTSGAHLGFSELGISPRPLNLFLDRWMVAYRRFGRFTESKPAS